ncbi:uncharacterized protein CMC5_069350 [Chondromyces crocatus]|uniref:Uncharacterized protein n=1 Tax=Chondromyces crocatus TaxID=52 RepID=A0A0K1EQ18_CHOCO|nr:uncharacterized protein CMC5_069350 [Chondromyces crocatus]
MEHAAWVAARSVGPIGGTSHLGAGDLLRRREEAERLRAQVGGARGGFSEVGSR